MEKREFEYRIGDKTYVQRTLVLGQIEQLSGIIEGLEITGDMKAEDILLALKDRVGDALGIILCEKGQKLIDKDLEAFARELRFAVEPEQIVEVIADFFDCNPIVSVFEKLLGGAGRITEAIKSQLAGLKKSA